MIFSLGSKFLLDNFDETFWGSPDPRQVSLDVFATRGDENWYSFRFLEHYWIIFVLLSLYVRFTRPFFIRKSFTTKSQYEGPNFKNFFEKVY